MITGHQSFMEILRIMAFGTITIVGGGCLLFYEIAFWLESKNKFVQYLMPVLFVVEFILGMTLGIYFGQK